MHHANAHANNQLREITYVAKQRNTHQNLQQTHKVVELIYI